MDRTPDARERLIRCGRALMLERGYTAVGIAELCDKAGVNKGSFYHAFPSKHDLAQAVIDRFAAETSALFDDMVTGSGPPLTRLRRFFDATCTHHRKRRAECGRIEGCLVGGLAQEMSAQDPVLRKRLAEVFEWQVGRFERVIAEAVGRGELPRQDARRAARSLTALHQGAMLLAKTANDPEPLARLGEDALRLLGARATRR